MNQASISKRASETWPLIESINCRATQSLPRGTDSSTSQERIGTVSADPSLTRPPGQGHPALAVHKGRPIGLPGVIVLDTDPRPGLRRARHQGVVDDQIRHIAGKHRLHQRQQTDRQLGGRDMCPLDQLVIGSPVRLATNGAEGAGDPAFRVEQAANQQFDEGTTGAGGYRHQKKGNPFREQQANRCGERQEGASEIRKDPSLVPALLALKSTPGEQRGELINRTSCQALLAFL